MKRDVFHSFVLLWPDPIQKSRTHTTPLPLGQTTPPIALGNPKWPLFFWEAEPAPQAGFSSARSSVRSSRLPCVLASLPPCFLFRCSSSPFNPHFSPFAANRLAPQSCPCYHWPMSRRASNAPPPPLNPAPFSRTLFPKWNGSPAFRSEASAAARIKTPVWLPANILRRRRLIAELWKIRNRCNLLKTNERSRL